MPAVTTAVIVATAGVALVAVAMGVLFSKVDIEGGELEISLFNKKVKVSAKRLRLSKGKKKKKKKQK